MIKWKAIENAKPLGRYLIWLKPVNHYVGEGSWSIRIWFYYGGTQWSEDEEGPSKRIHQELLSRVLGICYLNDIPKPFEPVKQVHESRSDLLNEMTKDC